MEAAGQIHVLPEILLLLKVGIFIAKMYSTVWVWVLWVGSYMYCASHVDRVGALLCILKILCIGVLILPLECMLTIAHLCLHSCTFSKRTFSHRLVFLCVIQLTCET